MSQKIDCAGAYSKFLGRVLRKFCAGNLRRGRDNLKNKYQKYPAHFSWLGLRVLARELHLFEYGSVVVFSFRFVVSIRMAF
jgi:hypothetical protein